jgi:hypothetical protein
MQILVAPAASRYQSRGVRFEQLDDGIGYTFVLVLGADLDKGKGQNPL